MVVPFKVAILFFLITKGHRTCELKWRGRLDLGLLFDIFSFQVLDSLFGSHLSSLILAPARTDDTTEGSARPHHSSSLSLVRGPAAGRSATRELPGKKAAVPQFFLDFLKRQSKIRRRGRTSMVGGRGCFGMKMDRIGSISGLGC